MVKYILTLMTFCFMACMPKPALNYNADTRTKQQMLDVYQTKKYPRFSYKKINKDSFPFTNLMLSNKVIGKQEDKETEKIAVTRLVNDVYNIHYSYIEDLSVDYLRNPLLKVAKFSWNLDSIYSFRSPLEGEKLKPANFFIMQFIQVKTKRKTYLLFLCNKDLNMGLGRDICYWVVVDYTNPQKIPQPWAIPVNDYSDLCDEQMPLHQLGYYFNDFDDDGNLDFLFLDKFNRYNHRIYYYSIKRGKWHRNSKYYIDVLQTGRAVKF